MHVWSWARITWLWLTACMPSQCHDLVVFCLAACAGTKLKMQARYIKKLVYRFSRMAKKHGWSCSWLNGNVVNVVYPYSVPCCTHWRGVVGSLLRRPHQPKCKKIQKLYAAAGIKMPGTLLQLQINEHVFWILQDPKRMNHAMNRPAAQVQHLLWAYSLYTYIYIYNLQNMAKQSVLWLGANTLAVP